MSHTLLFLSGMLMSGVPHFVRGLSGAVRAEKAG